jgi:hypothetical protein
MVSAWLELLSAKPAEPSAGVCDGQEARALNTSETPPNWRLIDDKIGVEGRRCKANSPSTLRVLRRLRSSISDIAN